MSVVGTSSFRGWRAPGEQPGRRFRAPALVLVVAALLLLTGAWLMYLTRGTTFSADEWAWILYRRGNDIGTFLKPWNEHMSLVPIVVYRLLLATAGMRHYAPYRLAVICAHLTVGWLLFVYARRRVGAAAAVIVSLMMLYLGPAWNNFLWPFQMAWLISLAAGIGALLLLDRKDRNGDIGACGLVALSLASSGIGLAMALGVVVEIVLRRERRRSTWIVAAPLLPYAVWWSHYESPNRGNVSGSWLFRHNLPLVPGFTVKAAATALSAIWGLAGRPTRGHATAALIFGWPLLAAAICLTVWRVKRLGRLSPRAGALLTMCIAFWTLTAIRRADYSLPYESRYLYVSALLIFLLACELGQGVKIPGRLRLALAVAAGAAIASNAVVLSHAAASARNPSDVVRAELGALELGRRFVAPDYVADPWQGIVASAYFSAERAYGTPAASPGEIARMPEIARILADAELIHIYELRLRAAPAACASLRPGAATDRAQGRQVETSLRSGALLLATDGAGATVEVRRFATQYESVGALPSRMPVELSIPRDSAPQPWRVRVRSSVPVAVCRLS